MSSISLRLRQLVVRTILRETNCLCRSIGLESTCRTTKLMHGENRMWFFRRLHRRRCTEYITTTNGLIPPRRFRVLHLMHYTVSCSSATWSGRPWQLESFLALELWVVEGVYYPTLHRCSCMPVSCAITHLTVGKKLNTVSIDNALVHKDNKCKLFLTVIRVWDAWQQSKTVGWSSDKQHQVQQSVQHHHCQLQVYVVPLRMPGLISWMIGQTQSCRRFFLVYVHADVLQTSIRDNICCKLSIKTFSWTNT